DGYNISVIYPGATVSPFVVQGLNWLRFEGIGIIFSTPATTGTSITMGGTDASHLLSNFIIKDVLISNGYNGISLLETAFGRVERATLTCAQKCLTVNNTTAADSGDTVVDRCLFTSTNSAGVFWQSSGGFKLINSKFILCTYGVYVLLNSGASTGQMTISS